MYQNDGISFQPHNGVIMDSTRQQEVVPIPMNASTRKSIRDAKMKKIKMDHSAASIQARWRGVISRKKVIPAPAMAAVVLKIAEKEQTKSSSKKDNNKPSPRQTGIDEDEDDNSVVGEENDKEESIADEHAVMEEQNMLQQEHEHVHIWPEPLTDDFNNTEWPNLDIDHEAEVPIQDVRIHEIQKWVHEKKKVHIRIVTWNLCARPPPDIEDTKKNLFPPNK